jgi:hypothetical protein
VVEILPKCGEHNLTLQLIRVEVSPDKTITDVFRCPHQGCRTEHRSQQSQNAMGSGK